MCINTKMSTIYIILLLVKIKTMCYQFGKVSHMQYHISGIPMGAFHSMFPVMVKDRFDLAPGQIGFLMSYVGIIVMVIITYI